MHDTDFPYQSKWEFYSVSIFRSSWKGVETKLESSKLDALFVK